MGLFNEFGAGVSPLGGWVGGMGRTLVLAPLIGEEQIVECGRFSTLMG